MALPFGVKGEIWECQKSSKFVNVNETSDWTSGYCLETGPFEQRSERFNAGVLRARHLRQFHADLAHAASQRP
jgi:hypothetical protein